MSEKCQCGHDYDDHVHRFGKFRGLRLLGMLAGKAT